MPTPNLHDYVAGRSRGLAAGVGLLIAAAWITLAAGLVLPIMTTTKEFWWFEIDRTTWSLGSGIATLYTDGHALLAVVVATFTVIVPVVKLAVVTLLWNGGLPDTAGRTWLGVLSVISKWSMLDVFVVGVVIVVSKLSSLADAQAREGLFVFAAHVLLSMVVTKLLHHLDSRRLAER
jgi:paraquat-inducible protein A